MRFAVAILIGWSCVSATAAQENKLNTRYEIKADTDAFPQKTPKEALTSVLKAIQANKIDYLVAQLSDPGYVDERIKKEHDGKFEGMVKEVTQKLLGDSDTVPELRRFVTDGEWEEADDMASAKVKGSNYRVYLRKLEGRWFLENRREGKK